MKFSVLCAALLWTAARTSLAVNFESFYNGDFEFKGDDRRGSPQRQKQDGQKAKVYRDMEEKFKSMPDKPRYSDPAETERREAAEKADKRREAARKRRLELRKMEVFVGPNGEVDEEARWEAELRWQMEDAQEMMREEEERVRAMHAEEGRRMEAEVQKLDEDRARQREELPGEFKRRIVRARSQVKAGGKRGVFNDLELTKLHAELDEIDFEGAESDMPQGEIGEGFLERIWDVERQLFERLAA
mmetsp:Transcript_5590/g.12990  ORF Transcript_5590/g.12990 Transcript_5590/m.12990 type:complete len:245 (+) Transcript_5590:175-909(+)|eukprot:CAMPEP_0172593676 /NCGR_PEP_ID=MMETSP1068-20121228/12920_1 /TAXON_ID=35684 /ORGANISM="Pseudopedinella elastica, Strain CCMP716" /LENGTH=244 /DNA_ID=CAMNT_0013391317 /DNA_START=151 /DNA_END=885 /DNA_ORIENTATION=-